MKSAFRIIAAAAAVVAGVGLTVPVLADGASDIQARVKAMKANGSHSKALKNAVAAGDKAEILKHAEELNKIGAKIHIYFAKGSGMSAGKTRAKDDIWSNASDFKKKADAYQKATAAMVASAKGGDMAKINKSFDALGKTCGGCHKAYRGPKT